MSEITGTAKVHEAYAFACMRCGHGWEQSYDIEHHHDASGQEFIVYKTDGVRVPSPLSSPTCQNCESHVVRIMRAGQVSSVHEHNLMEPYVKPATAAGLVESGPPEGSPAQTSQTSQTSQPESAEPRHWHLSDLFHRK
ncbi:hypothetical protein [Streptomyces sp. NPDC020681]|uniref:hypothetical protein n=1 Tax=Streptomyces sp. NPDC020681 TaxID=3365083 RepID=UPI003791D5B3